MAKKLHCRLNKLTELIWSSKEPITDTGTILFFSEDRDFESEISPLEFSISINSAIIEEDAEGVPK